MQNVWLGAFGFSWKAGKAKKQFQTARMDSKDGDLKLSWLEQKKIRFCCRLVLAVTWFFQGMDIFCLSYLQFKTFCSIKCCQNPIKMKYVLVSLNWDFISCVCVSVCVCACVCVCVLCVCLNFAWSNMNKRNHVILYKNCFVGCYSFILIPCLYSIVMFVRQ